MTKKTKIKRDKYLNSPKEFHLQMPLYYAIDISDEKIAYEVYKLLNYSGTLDAYCIWCKKESVFDAEEYASGGFTRWQTWGHFQRTVYKCTRDDNHRYYSYFLKEEKSFQKIGQFPSVADFQIPQAERYRSILGEEKYKELTRGIGLAAHGVGIGSFVYLRRIFEQLIEEAHKEASKKRFPEKKYSKSRMDEKIRLLENYLPQFLVENRSLYAILSKGIHELNEGECLEYFDAVRIGIEQILDEKIVQQEKEKKAKEAKKAVQAVSQKISEPQGQANNME